MIQSYGYTPHQHVFGKNPRAASDLLDEPLNVVPAAASLAEEQTARSQAIRTAARHAVVAMQNDLSLRRALAARPRVPTNFQAGELVAYWRAQKVHQGSVQQGGRWYGTAVIL